MYQIALGVTIDFFMHIFVNYNLGLHYVKCFVFKALRLKLSVSHFFLQFWGSRRFYFLFKTIVFTKTKTEDCSAFAVFCFILLQNLHC